MTHIITRACCNDAACVPVCPVNCIHPTPDEPDYATAEMLYIDPQSCVDCGACVDVCPVGAIVADYDLSDSYARYEDINARYFASEERTSYDPEPTPRRTRDFSAAPDEPLRVAIVGSGPAACYAAEEILSQRGLKAEVDMFEKLPTPWGLLRFGVAPDHQDTKAASASFARTMRRPEFRMFLNTEVGTHVTLEDLQNRYHAVIVAVGAMSDRSLAIPGEDLPGSHSATEFVAWYNGHPDFAGRTFDLAHERAVIIGNGNVALDVARILVSDTDKLEKTDIADHALEQLRRSTIKEVVVVGRRGPLQAAFTTKELLGLAETEGADLVVRTDELALDSVSMAAVGDPATSVDIYKRDLMAELGTSAPSQERRISLRFLASPVEIRGDGWVESVRLVRNKLVATDSGVAAEPTEDAEDLSCGLLFRSVGYRGTGLPGVPFDERRGVIPNQGGRVTSEDTAVPGVYTTGWIKRGPSGVIGTNKHCARETVGNLLEDFIAGILPAPQADTQDLDELLPDHVGLDGWKAIDDRERSEGKNQKRPRVKLVSVDDMLAVARQQN